MHFIPNSFGAQGVDLDKYDAARFVIINLLPLSNKQQTDAITAALKTQTGKDKKVSLSTVVNPDILGGIQVSIGDQFLDLSAAGKIQEYAGVLSK